MNDSSAVTKYRFMIDPILLVNNEIAVQIRKFLCTLLNTFDKTYQTTLKNSQYIFQFKKELGLLVTGLTNKESVVFTMQNIQIREQAVLEGELLVEMGRTNQESTRQGRIRQSASNVKQEYEEYRQKYMKQLEIVADLEKNIKQLDEESESMSRYITAKQKMRSEYENQIDRQLCYQEKLRNQVVEIGKEVSSKKELSCKLIKQLYRKRVQNANHCMRNSLPKMNRSVVGVGEQTRRQILLDISQEFVNLRG